MINSIEFENFRGLKHLKLPELSQITLLTGRNNAGKSSVLEGIFLFMDHASADSFGKLNSIRKIISNPQPTSYWEPAFYDLNTRNTLRILVNLSGEECSLYYTRDDSFKPIDKTEDIQKAFSQFTASAKSTYSLKFKYQQGEYSEDGVFSLNENGSFRTINTNLPDNRINFLSNARFIDPFIFDDASVATWLGQAELDNTKQQVIDSLKIIEPEISDITTIYKQNQVQMYVKVRNQFLPVRLAGDGLNRLLYIILAILESPNSILLIDEIDTGFHYSVLESVWKTIAVAAKQSGCQVIATTHSYECIDRAVDGIGSANMLNDFCLYRIERDGDKNRAAHYPGELVKEAVLSSMEVR